MLFEKTFLGIKTQKLRALQLQLMRCGPFVHLVPVIGAENMCCKNVVIQISLFFVARKKEQIVFQILFLFHIV